jgi:hypothetical protein
MVALGRVVLSTREHVIALEPRDRGIVGVLLHYPYEIRKPAGYFGDIPKVDTPKEMLDPGRSSLAPVDRYQRPGGPDALYGPSNWHLEDQDASSADFIIAVSPGFSSDPQGAARSAGTTAAPRR